MAAQMVTCDSYLRCVNLRFNKIGKEGIETLSRAIGQHHDFLSFDLRDNKGYEPTSETTDLIKYAFLTNIRKAVLRYPKTGMRVKLEWIFPHCLGLHNNNLDELP